MSAVSTQVRARRRDTLPPALWLVVTGLLLAALNLRTAVTSIGPLLAEIQAGLSTSAAMAGVLTTLPVICFAALGGVTPALVRRFGDRIVLLTALGAMVLGLVVRSSVTSVPVFLLASAAALAGGAVGNVAIPTIVKRYFPDRIGPLTTAYSTSLAVGAMLAAAVTVPVEQASGGDWQLALGVWVVPALVAMVPWLLLRRPPAPPSHTAVPAAPARVRGIGRSRLAWMMLVAFGCQSLIAYVMFGWLPEIMRDHGYSSAEAGVMLAVFTGISIPISLVIPVLAARRPTQRGMMLFLVSGYLLGLPAMWWGGNAVVTWVGLVLTAVAMGTFPLMLTLFALRTRTPTGTAALSAFAQSGGYLMAGVGPLLVGVLFEATGSWTLPFALLLVTAVVYAVAGWTTTGPHHLEDELPPETAG
ncbi:CP family cyanate transporter-like MFS transporter [Stackebrandtia albiflava]|uniref:CP family cyanate transporter-like MFS transporter n=1 Tax=Stackebrandtia albiflava TaxID=406432 RepID=A0A562VCW7_9ACTN|nr:MFS transporter [Stackebrandtia albiflava]TWJ15743.1 CP family cyanate transporter-like MFS transporter [Stackebrandtia albiflava]